MLLDFFERSDSLAAKRAPLVAGINQLSRAFRAHSQPVIWIRQEFRSDLRDAFPDMRRRSIRITIAGTKGAEILPELERDPEEPVIIKKRYSAFFRTQLEDLLTRLSPSALVLAGINTHACVRTTAIDAYQRDLDVIVAADCVGSYDEEHHSVTVKYLDGKIARFLENERLLALLAEGRSAADARR
jgi:nicotinamidase-related amidase